jgi:hypothetical protein
MKPTTQARMRELARRRLTRVNRMLVAGSLVLTGLFVDLASNAFHARTIAKAASLKGRRAGGPSSGTGSNAPGAQGANGTPGASGAPGGVKPLARPATAPATGSSESSASGESSGESPLAQLESEGDPAASEPAVSGAS